MIRGLNAQVYEDNFSDGDLLGGISHSLNGVKSIEVLEGPGSALFGSGPPGGTINIVHFTPSSELHYGASVQAGSFGTITNNDYITGPTSIPGLNYRIDATVSRSDGFRDLANRDYEIRPSLEWQVGTHTLDFALDLRHISETPDSYGIIYFNGSPIKNVPINAKYSTPFATSNEDVVRPTLTDAWRVTDFLTINNRLSCLHRSLDALSNGDSTSTKVSGGAVVGRQLKAAAETISTAASTTSSSRFGNSTTGPIRHTLLTGFEYEHQTIDTERSTADLPNILNAFAPIPPETSLAGINFLCNSSHSCDQDQLVRELLWAISTRPIRSTSPTNSRSAPLCVRISSTRRSHR